LLLDKLSETLAVSGHEDAVREVIRDAVEGLVDECSTDTLGNFIALKKGEASSPRRVMVSAHMDEIGLMIMHIENDGSLRFQPVGGIDARVLLAKTVLIGDNRVPGVIGMKPIHLLEKKERQQVMRHEQLSIDIGASSREQAEKLVKVGDYAGFYVQYAELGGDMRTVKGKAFDDRAGCAVLIELLRDSYPFDFYGVFTVQEEVGGRGARVAAYAIVPEVALVLEGTICDDLPKKRDVSPTTELAAGPAITIMDRSMISDRRIVRLLSDTAQEEGIPHQFKQPGLGGTDAGAIHLAREGVPTGVVSVPSRYIHSPACILSLNDFDNTLHLMRKTLSRVQDLDLDR
jgi:putative aminopeptidase FrvX